MTEQQVAEQNNPLEADHDFIIQRPEHAISVYHSLMPAQVLTIPHEANLQQFVAFCNAFEDQRVLDCFTYREQCYNLLSILHDDNDESDNIHKLKFNISLTLVGKCFSPPRDHSAITKQFIKYCKDLQRPGRPYVLSKEEVADIADKLSKMGSNYPTLTDIANYIYDKFHKIPSKTTIYNIIHRDLINHFKLVKAHPKEENRMDVTLDEIKKFYKDLAKELEGVPVGFVFNLDETGEDEFVDAKDQYIVVPKDSNMDSYPINRGRRITLLHCISTDGTSCKPLIVLPRKTIDNEIYDELAPHSILFRHQISGFCTAELFMEWFVLNFMPYLIYKRVDCHYDGKAVIIMDGFKGHTAAMDPLDKYLKKLNIKIVYFPAHSSDQLQPLDLLGFNIQKNKSKQLLNNFHYSNQTNQILAIVYGLDYIRSTHIVIEAWKMMGIFHERISNLDTVQYHKVDMNQNHNIRDLPKPPKDQQLQSQISRGKKYKPLPPNEIYPKRKEITINTQPRKEWTEETVNALIKAYEEAKVALYNLKTALNFTPILPNLPIPVNFWAS